MIGALAFSIAASGLASFIDVGPRRIRYWLRFVRRRYWPAQLGLISVYTAAGVGGWFLNKEYIVHPPSSSWLANGLLSVGVGQAILRFDPSLLDVDGRGPARSLLVGTQRALFDDIESSAFTAVVNSVRNLADDELEQLALDLARIAVIKKEVPPAAQVQTLNTLTDAATEMRATNHSNGRSRLVSFSVKTITENRYVFSF
jgi:hypothetical protein